MRRDEAVAASRVGDRHALRTGDDLAFDNAKAATRVALGCLHPRLQQALLQGSIMESSSLAFPGAKTAVDSGAWTKSRTAHFQASSPLKCRLSRGCQTTRSGRDAVLVGGRAPAKGFGDEVPGH